MDTSHEQKRTTKVSTRHLQPPLTLGPYRLHYQYSAVLPQVHLVLISVLQGIAFGVLFLNFPYPGSAHCPIRLASAWSDGLHCAESYHAFLPYVVSFLLVLGIWMQFMNAILYSIWPVSVLQAGLIFLIAFLEVAAFESISSLSIWLFWLGCVGSVGGLIRYRNLHILDYSDFEKIEGTAKAARMYQDSHVLAGIIYPTLGVAVWILDAAYLLLDILYRQSQPRLIEGVAWGAPILLIIVLLLVIRDDAKLRLRILAAIVSDTDDLALSADGVLRYKTPEPIPPTSS